MSSGKFDPPDEPLPKIPSDPFLAPTTLPPPPPPPIYEPGSKLKFISPSEWMVSKEKKNTKTEEKKTNNRQLLRKKKNLLGDHYAPDVGTLKGDPPLLGNFDLPKKGFANYSLPENRVANYSVGNQGLGNQMLTSLEFTPSDRAISGRSNEKLLERDRKSGHQTVLGKLQTNKAGKTLPEIPPRPGKKKGKNKKKGPKIPKRPLTYYFGGKKSLKKRKKRKRGYGGKSPKRRTKKRKGRRTKKRKSRKKRKRTKTRRRKN